MTASAPAQRAAKPARRGSRGRCGWTKKQRIRCRGLSYGPDLCKLAQAVAHQADQRAVAGIAGRQQRAMATCRALYSSGWPWKSVNKPPASCTSRSAAARSQSWLPGEAKAASSSPCATRAMPQRQRRHPRLRQDASDRARRASRDSASVRRAWRRRASRRRWRRSRAPLSVAPSPCDREEHLLAHRRKQRGQTRPAGFDQRDRNAPIGAAGDIGAGAVDRIDHPGERQRAVGQLDGLLRQPAGAGQQASSVARATDR